MHRGKERSSGPFAVQIVSYNAQLSQCLVKVEFCVWELPLSPKQPFSHQSMVQTRASLYLQLLQPLTPVETGQIFDLVV